jgi:hypothetical protein
MNGIASNNDIVHGKAPYPSLVSWAGGLSSCTCKPRHHTRHLAVEDKAEFLGYAD